MGNKINVVITARPSWSRVKSLILNYAELVGPKNISIFLTGPAVSDRYGNIKSQIPADILVNAFPTLKEGSDFSSITISSLEGGTAACQTWTYNRPDAVLVIADRVETLGISLAAASMQIPLIHLQGGEFSGSIDDKIRDANSKLADLHLTTNNFTFKNLVAMGELPENIRIVGCPSIDILKQQINSNTPLHNNASDYGGVGEDFMTSSPFGIIMFHPDTLNIVESEDWVENIYKVIERSEMNWFWFWPNPDFGSDNLSKILRKKRESSKNFRIRYIINLTPEKFMDLTIKSKIMIGNSSFGIREASYLGLPVINLGKRQFSRERSQNVLDIDLPRDFLEELKIHLKSNFKSSLIYGDGNAGKLASQFLANWEPKLKLRS